MHVTAVVVLFIVLSITVPALSVENISITGGITFDPDISTAWIFPTTPNRTERAQCDDVTSPEECLSRPGCAWYDDPRGVSPEGAPSEDCAPEGMELGKVRDHMNNNEPVTLRVDGILVTAPATMFVFKQTVLSTPGPVSVLGTATVDATRTSASIVAPLHFFGPAKHFFIICVNDTPCPSWDDACSTCISSEKVVYWTDPETGAVIKVDTLIPTTQLETPFAGHPSLWKDEIERVTATMGEGHYDSIYNDTLRTCREFPPNSTLSVKVPSNITLTEDGPFDTDSVKGPEYFTVTQKVYCFKRLSEINYNYTLALCPHLPQPERSACFGGVSLWEWYYLGAVLDHQQTRMVEGPAVTVTEVSATASGTDTPALIMAVLTVVALGYVLLLPDEKVGRPK